MMPKIKLTSDYKDEYNFKGQESIDDWSKKLEDIAISMSFATDKRGLMLFANPDLMVLEFMKQCEFIQQYMNVSDGPCGLIPGAEQEE